MASGFDSLRAALADRYEIERELGQGGMATVYLAKDLKHERQVAIKVLKPELAAVIGAERFLAEIKTTANLQHPNILPLFDSGQADTFLYYVMPYVEGETLRDRLDREKQLPVEDAARIATDVAEALDHAHGRGVIHRDIKPANILLQEGRAVVADFGVALAVQQAGGDRLTESGTSLGTPHYMSPEQASADPNVSGRSDLYSLGAVLYEMLAGDPPHTGRNSHVVLTRILTEDPRSVIEARRSVPPNVGGAAMRSLEKLPADRFASGEDFANAVRDVLFRWPPDAARPAKSSTARLAAFGLAAVMTVVAGLGWWRPTGVSETETTRLEIAIPPGQQLSGPIPSFPFDLSRDGRQLIYLAQEGGQARLFLRELDSFDTPRALPGTEGARQPFFSPDGAWVGFFASGELRRASTEGGDPEFLANIDGEPWGASWSSGSILYSTDGGGLYTIPETGGLATPVPLRPVNHPVAGATDSAATIVSGGAPRWPQLLPGGLHALVTLDGGSGVLDLSTGDFEFIASEVQAKYLESGHLLLHAGEGVLRVAPFDVERLEITGDAVPALERVFRGPGSGAANVRVSETGTVVFVSGGFGRSLVRVDRRGLPEPLPFEARGYRFPDVSPDGRWLAVTVDPRDSEIWVLDLVTNTERVLVTGKHNLWPIWDADGDRLTFWRETRPAAVPWPNGGEPVLLTEQRLNARGWLADGRYLGELQGEGTGQDLRVFDPNTGEITDLSARLGDERQSRVSEDGRWIAFAWDVSGTLEVHVLPSSGAGTPLPVSVGGGADPRWSLDGTELYYRNGNTIVAVPIQTSPTLSAGSPEPLFSGPYDFSQESNWDVTPNGLFVMIRPDPRALRFSIVGNWFEELRNR